MMGYSDLPEILLREKRRLHCGGRLKGFERGITAPNQNAKIAECFGNAVSFETIGSTLCSLVGQRDYQYGHRIPVIIYGVVLILQVLLPCLLTDPDRENKADYIEPDNGKEEE
ncbi:hypothetical protein ACTXT7_010579, partial [Hymenolepis weldensis]